MNDEKTVHTDDLRPRTKAFALRVIKLYMSLPETEEVRVLGKQVLRSGTSVGANYCEACRARSKQEFAAKIGDSLRELDKSGYWLELLVESGLLPTHQLDLLQDECNQLIAIFATTAKETKAAIERESGAADQR